MSDMPVFQPAELVAVHRGQVITTSIRVAEVFGKLHKDVLRAIESLDCSDEFRERNFAPTEEILKSGAVKRKRRYYEMTRDGFVFLAMGFTGKKAARFKEAYINAFNAMERELRGETDDGASRPLNGREAELLRRFVAHLVEQRRGLTHQTLYAVLRQQYGVRSFRDLPTEHLAEAMARLSSVGISLEQKQPEEASLPAGQVKQLAEHFGPLTVLFHPFSEYAHHVRAVHRVLLGLDPATGQRREDFRAVIPARTA